MEESNRTGSGKFNIRLNIAGKTYPLTIERSEEEKYRRAEREINTLVGKFRTRFKAEGEDYLAMAALQISLSLVEMEMSRSVGQEIEQLMELEQKIDAYLSKT